MRRPVALLAVAALFLAGVAVGVLGSHLYESSQRRDRRPEALWFMGRPAFERLAEDLELSEPQLRRIEEILRQSRREGEELRQEIRPRIRELAASTHDQVMEVFTPEQQEAFERLPRHRRRHWGHLLRGHRHRHQDGGIRDRHRGERSWQERRQRGRDDRQEPEGQQDAESPPPPGADPPPDGRLREESP